MSPNPSVLGLTCSLVAGDRTNSNATPEANVRIVAIWREMMEEHLTSLVMPNNVVNDERAQFKIEVS